MKAGLSGATVRNYEAGQKVRTSTIRDIRDALESLMDARVVRNLAGMNDDDVTDYFAGLPADRSDRLMARILDDRVRRARGNGDSLGEI